VADLNDETICAIATPVGEGGIGIVRVSGAKAIPLASMLMRLRSGAALESGPARTIPHGGRLMKP
jgi:tRNA modification GTPase